MLLKKAVFIFLFPAMANAALISGKVETTDKRPVHGAMITITSEDGLFAETIYSNEAGKFAVETKQSGSLAIRVRKAYFRDVSNTIDINGENPSPLQFTLRKMTSAKEISDSLSASAHFARIKFDDPIRQQWFKVDCLTCHQIGNAYTRMPKSSERWSQVLTRMLGFYGINDEQWAKNYADILFKTYDGGPADVIQKHETDPLLHKARILQWKLPQGMIAHDVEYNEEDGKFYTVDQGNDQIYITDPETKVTETFKIPDGGIPIGGKFKTLLGQTNPFSLNVSRGPHSLQHGPNGNFYTTDTVSGQIGEFNPKTRSYVGHDIGGKALYPHTLRFDKRHRVWFTLAVSNQVGVYDTVNDKMTVIDLPAETDRKKMPALFPYGLDVNPVDGSVWYASLLANRIGRIDPDSLEVTVFTPPLIGPRRMRFDKTGTLWIPGYGTGSLVKLDTVTMKYKSYDIPALSETESEAPYAVGVHPVTQEVWITANMSDRLFRFLPEEERFIAYPVPTRGTFLRDVVFTSHGWVCANSSPVPPALTVEGGMQEILCVEPDKTTKVVAGH